MYQTDFICTYKQMDEADDQEQLYRLQLLQAFGLEQWDDQGVNNTLLHIFELLHPSPDFQKILSKAQQTPAIKDLLAYFSAGEAEAGEAEAGAASPDEAGEALLTFKLLFKYEYFDMIHRCISDYLNCQTMNLAGIMKVL
jgi:hypothetical protein